MTPTALLQEIESRGVSLSAVDGRLRLSGPRAALGPDLIAMAREQKADLVRLVATGAPPPWPLSAWADALGPDGLRCIPGDPLTAEDLAHFWEEATGRTYPLSVLYERLEHGVAVGALERHEDRFTVAEVIVDPPNLPLGLRPWHHGEVVVERLQRPVRGEHRRD